MVQRGETNFSFPFIPYKYFYPSSRVRASLNFLIRAFSNWYYYARHLSSSSSNAAFFQVNSWLYSNQIFLPVCHLLRVCILQNVRLELSKWLQCCQNEEITKSRNVFDMPFSLLVLLRNGKVTIDSWMFPKSIYRWRHYNSRGLFSASEG